MSNEITNEFFAWIRGEGTGCLFARRFSLDPSSPQYWASSVIPGHDDYARIASAVQAFFVGAIGSAEAAQVILPDISSVEEIASLINALCATQNWYCVELQVAGQKQSLLVGLRWLLPDEQHVNWALGFANLDSMPITRRAPYTALMVRPGNPGKAPSVALNKPREANERRLDRGKIPVHLADMETKMSDDVIRRHWYGTQKTKAAKLKNDQMAHAAKAKVTFSFPLEFRHLLNCISDTVELT